MKTLGSRRVGKDPAGDLVASIRSDDKAPGDFAGTAEAKVEAAEAEDPGIGRFKNMLEPPCLAALEKSTGGGAAARKGLFPGLD